MRPAVLRAFGVGAVLSVLWGCSGTAPGPAPLDDSGGASAVGVSAGTPAELAANAAVRPAARCASAELWPELGPLPRQLGGFCLDAYARVRTYAEDAPEPLDRACEQILGPGCNDTREHGLTRVVALRYRDQLGGPATLDLVVSGFADAEGAYANFTERLLGEGDPLALRARSLEAPGVAVLDAERAAAWLGRYVVGIDYGDDSSSSAQRSADAAVRLPEALRRVLEALPNEPDLPLAVQRLPEENRIPLGVRLLLGDVLGMPGIGAGAIGYYREGEKRWRVLSVVRPDADAARDVLGTLSQSPAARPVRNAPLEAIAFTERRLPNEPSVGWVVGQRQEVIYGVGDEPTALPELMSAEREAAVKLSLLDKLVKLTRTHIE
jgi:hypothetical protein